MRKFFYSLLALFCACLAAIVAHKLLNCYRSHVLYGEYKSFSQKLFAKDADALADFLSRFSAQAAEFSGRAEKYNMPQDVQKLGAAGALENMKNAVLREENGGFSKIYADFFGKLGENKNSFAPIFAAKFSRAGAVSENADIIATNAGFYLEDFIKDNSRAKSMEFFARSFVKSFDGELPECAGVFEAVAASDAPLSGFIKLNAAKIGELPDISKLKKAFSNSLKSAEKAALARLKASLEADLEKLHSGSYEKVICIYLK